MTVLEDQFATGEQEIVSGRAWQEVGSILSISQEIKFLIKIKLICLPRDRPVEAYIWEIIIKHPQTDGSHVSLLITYPSRGNKKIISATGVLLGSCRIDKSQAYMCVQGGSCCSKLLELFMTERPRISGGRKQMR